VGIYLWSFGDDGEVSPEDVRMQLDRCRDFMKEGKLEGFILHSNAVADMEFAAVAEAKKWMAEHGDELI
jgi:hypothetical protein